MSDETISPAKNDIRYDITISYFKQNTYVVYEMKVKDLGLGSLKTIFFRFSDISTFHTNLLKVFKGNNKMLPQFPSKNSFIFWNKTNHQTKKIEQRKRDLEYYFYKVFNVRHLRGVELVKKLLRSGILNKKSSSVDGGHAQKEKERKSLPKTEFNHFKYQRNASLH